MRVRSILTRYDIHDNNEKRIRLTAHKTLAISGLGFLLRNVIREFEKEFAQIVLEEINIQQN